MSSSTFNNIVHSLREIILELEQESMARVLLDEDKDPITGKYLIEVLIDFGWNKRRNSEE